MKRFRFVDGPHNVLLYGACIGIAAAFLYTGNAFVAVADFSVIDSEFVCQQPLNNRCVTRYKVKDVGSLFTRTYEPYGYQFSADDLATGYRVSKRLFSFSYFINGRERYWIYGPEMLIVLLSSVVVIAIWYRWTKALG